MNSSNKAYLPSQRMLPGFVAGLPSPSSVSSHSSIPRAMPPVSEHSPKSPTSMAYESYRDSAAGGNVAAALAGVYRGSPAETSAKAAAVASLAYARMQQDTGFPYGISGVAMPSYNYSNELYNYVSNGFPRKSRICSYCAKVFTRSTTRRYHEKRCPLLRAAGSLMKGSADVSTPSAHPPATSGTSDGNEPGASVHPSHPPPLLAMTGESPPPLLTSSTTSLTATTSLGPASAGRPNPLSSSSFYTSYGSHCQSFLATSVTSPAISTATLRTSPHAVSSSSNVDQNRNSVLTAVKQEADQAMDVRSDAGAVETEAHTQSPGSRESELLRNKYRSRGGGEHGQQIFSPLSATSQSPSPGSGSVDDDADFDEAEDLTLRSAASVVKPALLTGGDMYSAGSAPQLKPYYLSDLARAQAASQETGTRYMISGTPNMDSTPPPVKVKTESGQDVLDASSDKDDSSYRDEDVSLRDEDDLDRMEYRQSVLEDMEDPVKPADDKKCGVCNQQFDSLEELRTHKLCHQKYKASACRFCGQRFLRTSMRMAHERLHSSEFPYGCVVCGKQFTRLFSLRQHVRRRHFKTKSKPQPCRHCGKQIASVFHLRNHVLTHRVLRSELMSLQFLHARPPTSSPPVDEEASQELRPPPSIDSKASQDSPVEIRSEPPPLIEARTLLGMTTPTAADDTALVNGGSSASGSRDMEWCRLCEKEYPKSFMRYHERAHADQKPYECPTCGKRFGYKNNMKSHMKLHAGIKPYQCQICGAKFTRGSTLRRHARRHGITTDTIWDLFVPKQGKQAGVAERAALLNQAAVREANMAALQKGPAQRQRSPPEVAGGSRAMKADPSLVASMAAAAAEVSPGGKTFDMRGYSPSPSLAQNLFASYSGLPAVTQAMYQPYMATSQFLGYPAPGFSPTPVPAVQSDALNLSMPDRHRRNSASSSTAAGQSRPPSTAALSQGLPQHPGLAAAARSAAGQQHIVIADDEEEKTEEESGRGEYTAERGGFVTNSNSTPSAKPQPVVEASAGSTRPLHPASANDFGVQVTLCCATLPPTDVSNHNHSSNTAAGGAGEGSPVDMSGGSPSAHKSGVESLQHESLANLMSTGRLFRCPYCDCYFTDYALFRIHQKYHAPDQPFTCTTCQEDCGDKVYFALHMYEHHRR